MPWPASRGHPLPHAPDGAPQPPPRPSRSPLARQIAGVAGATLTELCMALATIPGYPRIGKHRELKKALEGFWSGKIGEDDLRATAAGIRRTNWAAQKAAGLGLLPINDFSL